MKMGESCRGCVWLFTRDDGYSNYSVMYTKMHCVMGVNPHLANGQDIPSELSDKGGGDRETKRDNPALDRWWATCNARCEQHTTEPTEYSLNDGGFMHHIDCDGDEIMKPQDAADHALTTADPMPMMIAKYFAG